MIFLRLSVHTFISIYMVNSRAVNYCLFDWVTTQVVVHVVVYGRLKVVSSLLIGYTCTRSSIFNSKYATGWEKAYNNWCTHRWLLQATIAVKRIYMHLTNANLGKKFVLETRVYVL